MCIWGKYNINYIGLVMPIHTDNLSPIYNLVYHTEAHIHNGEKWLGAATSPSGETHVADRMGGGISPFVLTTGNDTYGSWVQILGSTDTPIVADSVDFDGHRVMVTVTDSTAPFKIEIVAGESAGIAAKIAAEQYTEIPYISATNNADSGVTELISYKLDVGTKMWARAVCIGETTKSISFYYGIHEYLK